MRPARGLFLALSLAHNERAPSEVELFADGVHIATAAYETGDINLDAEKVNTLEGTLHYDVGKLTGDLHVYGSKYDGFIDERATGATFDFDGEEFAVYRFVQTGAKFYGFEAEGSYALWESGDSKFAVEGQADYVKADTDLGPAARIPPYSVTGRLAWTSTPFDASVELRHVGKQDEVTAAAGRPERHRVRRGAEPDQRRGPRTRFLPEGHRPVTGPQFPCRGRLPLLIGIARRP